MNRALPDKSAKPSSSSSAKADDAARSGPPGAAPAEPAGLHRLEPLQIDVLGSDLHGAMPPSEIDPLWSDLGPDSTSRHALPEGARIGEPAPGPAEPARARESPGARGTAPQARLREPRDARGTEPPAIPAFPDAAQPARRLDSAVPARPAQQARGYSEPSQPPTVELPSRPPRVELPHRPTSGKVSPYPGRADLRDIQGLVYHAWADHPFAAYQLARFGEAPRARAWLAAVQSQVTAALGATSPGLRLQIALSPRGLEALGVPASVVAQLPHEARAGMHERARVLGDESPTSWDFGERDELHVLVMIFAKDAALRDAAVSAQRNALVAAGASPLPVELSAPLPGQREHFGFVDGISQPFIRGLHAAPRPGQDPIAAGEIVLGYPNAYDRLPHSPRWDELDLGHNGSYLVFRKLEQHVERFWGYLAERAVAMSPDDPAAVPALTERLAAKMMGRWRSGAPMALAPDHDDPAALAPERINTFGYRDADSEGLRCPISSHVRRANPRDSHGGSTTESLSVIARHRILRRGRPWGPPLAEELSRAGRGDQRARGLYFICLQTSIARGFEFIQQSWLNNRGFGRLNGEGDPLIGAGCPFTIPAEPVRLRLPAIPRVVTTRGGGYFFLPSITALARIAKGP